MSIKAPFPWFLLAGLLVALVLGATADEEDRGRSAAAAAGPLAGRVVRVTDGDTVRVRLDRGGRVERVRLIGVDTPEVSTDPPECFGPAAARFLARELDGERVRLERDDELRDRYGRLLAYVRRARDGRFLNAELVAHGYGEVLVIRPNDRYAPRLRDLERRARTERRGLWGACDRTPAEG